MNYARLCALKDAIDTFNDAEFVTVIDESSVAIKNTKDNSIWKIGFSFNEADEVEFSSDVAEKLKEEEEKEEEINYKEELKNAYIFDSINENTPFGIQYIKKIIEEGRYSFGKQVSDIINESHEESDEEQYYFNESVDYSKEEKVKILEITERWEEKINSVRNDYLDLLDAGNLFNEENEVKEVIINPLKVIKKFSQKKSYIRDFLENKNKIADLHETLNSIFSENEELKNSVVSNIDLNQDQKQLETNLTKTLVIAKRDFNEDFNIREKVKEVLEAVNEYNESLGQHSYDNDHQFNYLKVNAGWFTRRELALMMEDFSFVLNNFLNLSREEQTMIQEMKDTIDYMYRTNTIVDEVVYNVMDTFNNYYFSKKEDQVQKLVDPSYAAADVTGMRARKYMGSLHG